MQRVFCKLSWYSGHVSRAPGENFPLLAEEGHEGSCLFFWEVRVDSNRLVRVRWVKLVGDCVAIDAEVAIEFFLTHFCLLVEICFCLCHGYLFELLLGSKRVRNFRKITVTLV